MPDRENKPLARSVRFDKGQKGFSLVEILIALVIFLIVTAAIYGLLQVGRIDRNRSSRRSDIMKNARVAVHLIGRDALNAGLGYHRKGAYGPDNLLNTLFGFPADPDVERDNISAVVAANDLLPNSLLTNPAARTDMVVFAYRDVDFNGGDVLPLRSVASPTGFPSTPRLESNVPGGMSVGEVHDLYLIESESSQVAIMATNIEGTDYVDAAPGDPLGINQPLDGVGPDASVLRPCASVDEEYCTTYNSTNTSLRRFFLVSYHVKADGTLVRTTYGNNRGGADDEQIQEQPMAYHVEDLQIQYVLESGKVTDAPTAASPGPDGDWDTTADNLPDELNLIRQITITLKVQATEADEQTGRPETITLNATFSTRNMEYDAG